MGTKVSEKQAIIGPGLLRRRCCCCGCSSASHSCVHVNGQRSGYLNEEIENTAFFSFGKNLHSALIHHFPREGKSGEPRRLFFVRLAGGRADCPRFDQRRSEPCEGCPARSRPGADCIISVAATPQNGCCLEQFPLPGRLLAAPCLLDAAFANACVRAPPRESVCV